MNIIGYIALIGGISLFVLGIAASYYSDRPPKEIGVITDIEQGGKGVIFTLDDEKKIYIKYSSNVNGVQTGDILWYYPMSGDYAAKKVNRE